MGAETTVGEGSRHVECRFTTGKGRGPQPPLFSWVMGGWQGGASVWGESWSWQNPAEVIVSLPLLWTGHPQVGRPN